MQSWLTVKTKFQNLYDKIILCNTLGTWIRIWKKKTLKNNAVESQIKVFGTIKKWVCRLWNCYLFVFHYDRLIVSSQIRLSQKIKDGLLMWLITGWKNQRTAQQATKQHVMHLERGEGTFTSQHNQMWFRSWQKPRKAQTPMNYQWSCWLWKKINWLAYSPKWYSVILCKKEALRIWRKIIPERSWRPVVVLLSLPTLALKRL